MERCSIVSKFAILSYLITLVTLKGLYDNGVIILCMLLFISINMGMHIIKRASWKKVLLALSVIFIILQTIFIFKSFILLLPINILEIIIIFELNENIYIIGNGLLLLYMDKELISLYILICIFTLAYLRLGCEARKRINNILTVDESLREENFKLNSMLSRDLEYENQLKYVSQLEERNKIAQEIHDNIGHTLSASLMQLEAANLLMDRDKDMSRSIIQNTINVLRDGMENIRATLRNIKPASEQMGINRIKLLLDKFKKDNNIDVTLVYKGNLELISYKQWKVIHDNINECLTNTLRYSKATKVMVNVGVLNKLTKVEIKDNGFGAIKISKGLGIRGIEERTEGIGGKVIIDGSNGFSVIMLLPIG